MTTRTAQARGERGFSVLEVVIAMAIAGILMAVIVPSLLSQKQDGVNATVVGAAQTFEQAVAEYLRSFPPVGGPDPLLSRSGYAGPFTRDLPPDRGLFGVAGDPLVKVWPTNAFTQQPVQVLRGACTTPASRGDVLACRPTGADGRPDLRHVRIIAWGRDRNDRTIVAYDSVTCGGPCPVASG